MKLLYILAFLFTTQGMAQSPSLEDPCTAQYFEIPSDKLETLTTPYFKILSFYTKDSKYDPSADLLYFMALNFYLHNSLSYEQNKELEAILDKVPGKTPYLAPTIDVQIPHMLKYLEKIGKNVKDKDGVITKTNELMEKMRKILPEVQGGNRVIHRTIESEHQKIEKDQKDGTYIVRVENCPVRFLMDMHEYSKFNSREEEKEELKNRVNSGDILSYLKNVRDQLSDKSYFKEKLNKFISENSNN